MQEEATKREPLAKVLAKRKDEDIEQSAEQIAKKICQLAELLYKESVLTFIFKKDGFFKVSASQMIPIPDIQRKQKLIAKQKYAEELENKKKSDLEEENENQSLSEKDIQSESNLPEAITFTEDEKIHLEIVEIFNNIATSIEGSTGFSLEQERVLKAVTEKLVAENFDVTVTEKFFEIAWWGLTK